MGEVEYPIVQCNGQRIYRRGGPPPERGSEVFVGNLPKDLLENELIPLFSIVGPVHTLRLMMDFCGSTRGFCFVTYFNREDANMAVENFDQTTIRSRTKTSRMTVDICLDNRKLFFGKIPREKSSDQIRTDVQRFVDGVTEVTVYRDTRDSRRNRGFAFVEFESHAMAAIARRKLLAGVIALWDNLDGTRLHVDWAEPEPMVDHWDLQQVKILYVKNIPVECSMSSFRQLLLHILRGYPVEKIYKRDNYAFVHFYTRSEAETALKIFAENYKSLVFARKQLEVEWARPPIYSKKNRCMEPVKNLCLSVPPRIRKQVLRTKRTMIRPPNHAAIRDGANSSNIGTTGSPDSYNIQNYDTTSIAAICACDWDDIEELDLTRHLLGLRI